MALIIWISTKMRRSPKSPKEPFSWIRVWVWFRYADTPVISVSKAVIVELRWPRYLLCQTGYPFGAVEAQGVAWSLVEIKTPFTRNKRIWQLPLHNILSNMQSKTQDIPGEISAQIPLTMIDCRWKVSLRPSLVHFPETWALSSPGSCFTADSQLMKQGECWGLTSVHFPFTFTINAMCKHLNEGQDSLGALSSVCHLNKWKESDFTDVAASWHLSDIYWWMRWRDESFSRTVWFLSCGGRELSALNVKWGEGYIWYRYSFLGVSVILNHRCSHSSVVEEVK